MMYTLSSETVKTEFFWKYDFEYLFLDFSSELIKKKRIFPNTLILVFDKMSVYLLKNHLVYLLYIQTRDVVRVDDKANQEGGLRDAVVVHRVHNNNNNINFSYRIIQYTFICFCVVGERKHRR